MSAIPAILKLDVGGLPIEWMGWEDAVCAYASDKVLWDLGDKEIRIHGGHGCDGARSFIDIAPIIAVNDKSRKWHKSLVPPLCRKTLWTRDGGICLYCGKKLSYGQMEIEHVVPRAQGGPNKWRNVVSSCPDCNDRKGNRTPEQAHMPLLAVPYEPNTAEWLILSGRNILSNQMEYLTKFVPKRPKN